MSYQALIFDLDGTLVDSLTDLANAGNRILEDLGMPVHPESAYRTFVGDGLNTLIYRILPKQSRKSSLINDAVDRFRKDYSTRWHENTRPYDGICQTLDKLVAAKMPIAILSNKPHDFTRMCVEKLLPHWKFRAVLGQRPDVPKKPDAAAALEIAEMLKLPPSHILFVGDSSVDMQTAVNAGMDAAGVLWGFRTAEELRSNGAKYLLEHPIELVEIVRP